MSTMKYWINGGNTGSSPRHNAKLSSPAIADAKPPAAPYRPFTARFTISLHGYWAAPLMLTMPSPCVQGGFNWSSQHLEHGGVLWEVTKCLMWNDRPVPEGSGLQIGRCVHRCVPRVDRNRHGRCSGSSGD